ncbi:MAG: hypothetical protein KDD40_08040 [Bdellovibrionales bacterium]|nr:hypothetical protein [Bdellovibrionales bacterium]
MKIYNTLLTVFFALMTLQCGDKGEDGNNYLTVSLKPKSPTVKLTTTTVSTNDGEKELQAPWIAFRMKLTNNTADVLTITSMEFTVSYTKNGALLEGTGATYTPSDFVDSNNETQVGYIVQIPANGSEVPDVTFYLENLPNADENEADSYIFRIEGIIEGFTTTDIFDENSKDIRQKFYFSTDQPNL